MIDKKLQITMGDKTVAHVWLNKTDETYKFEYNEQWKKDGFAISPHIKLNHPTNSGVIKDF